MPKTRGVWILPAGLRPSFLRGTSLGAPDFERSEGTWSGWVASPGLGRGFKDEEEIIMTRVAKLLAVAAIPALLIAASGPLLAGGGGGGGGVGGGVGAAGAAGGAGVGAGAGAGHGGVGGVGHGGHGSSVSAA